MMRKRYVPSHYTRVLHDKLQKLKQGGKSVEEYYKELEVAQIRANVEESREMAMARFMSGLNYEIRDVVELQDHLDIEELVHQATKVEQQLKRKSSYKRSNSNYNSNHNTSTWKDKDKSKKEGASSSKHDEASAKHGHKGTQLSSSTTSSTSSTTSTRCFRCRGRGHIASQCQNKRALVIKDGFMVTESEKESCTSSSSSSSGSEEEVEEQPLQGDLLMVRRLLGVNPKIDDSSQRENIFHTRCLVNGKFCSLIIDGGSCTNVASTRLVTKLNLPTISHP